MAQDMVPLLHQVQITDGLAVERVAYCDAHDLLAVLHTGPTSEHAASVYRLHGGVAFTIAQRDNDDINALALQWKPDGSLLAVTWSDEVCCLYSGENGKLLYELPVRRVPAGDDAIWSLDIHASDVRADPSDVSDQADDAANERAPITWTSYDDNAREAAAGSKVADGEATTDDLFELLDEGPASNIHVSPDAPSSVMSNLINAITTIDTTSVLPRLSKIETAAGMGYSPEGSKFSTQASTDVIFDASSFAPGVFSTLLASNTQGCVTVLVDETIKVGDMQLAGSDHVKSASHPRCPSQVVLSRVVDRGNDCRLNFVDLPLARLGSPLNYIVSLNTRRLQSLMSYITHAIRCVHQEIQTGIKGVPLRLMKLLEEDLQSASGGPTVAPSDDRPSAVLIELQHLALTSNFHPVILEWLKDIVKETGHKRWDQAVNAMYDHIQAYLFQNLLPALQRFVAAASALRGQAHFQQHTGIFNVELAVFDRLIESADTLAIAAQRTIRVVTDEHVQFKAFSKWLRVMIDVAVAGPGTKGADETEEREAPNYDIDLCLRYIKGPLMGSLLLTLAEATPPVVQAADLAREAWSTHPIITAMSKQKTLAALEKLDTPDARLPPRPKDFAEPHPADPINLPLLACLLKIPTRIALEQVNAWQAQAIPSAPDVVTLQDFGQGPVYDMIVRAAGQLSQPSAQQAQDQLMQILTLRGSRSSQATDEGEDPAALVLVNVVRSVDDRQQGIKAEPIVHSRDIPVPSRTDESTHGTERFSDILSASFVDTSVTHSSYKQREPRDDILMLARSPASGATVLALLSPPSPSTWQALRTWEPPSNVVGVGSAAASAAFTPTSFVVGGRPGKRVVLAFSSLEGIGTGTKWEVLDFDAGLRQLARDGQEGGDDGHGERDLDVPMY